MNYCEWLLLPGTLITEWDDGKKRCETFLSSEDSYKALADKLVEISAYYGFDGWLVNIENVIEVSGVCYIILKPCHPKDYQR